MILAELPIYRLTQYIEASGFTTGFTDYLGNSQPALLVQAGLMNLSANSSKRIAAIVRSGGNSSPAASQYTITPHKLILYGLASPSNATGEQYIIEGLAKDFYAYMIDNYKIDDCMYQLRVTGGISPIGESMDKRPYIMISFELWES